MPPRSTNAPKGVIVLTRPVSSAPGTMRMRVSCARLAASSLSSEGLVQERIGILDFAEGDLGERAEGAKAGDAHVESALVPAGDLALDRESVFKHLAKLIEAGFAFHQLAGDSDLLAGMDDGCLDRVPDFEPFQLCGSHDRFRRSAVRDEGVVAGDRNDLTAQQVTLPGSFEIEARFERLGESSLSGISGMRHGIGCCLSNDWFSVHEDGWGAYLTRNMKHLLRKRRSGSVTLAQRNEHCVTRANEKKFRRAIDERETRTEIERHLQLGCARHDDNELMRRFGSVWIAKQVTRMLLCSCQRVTRSWTTRRVAGTVGLDALWWLSTDRERARGTRDRGLTFFLGISNLP